MFLKTDKHCIEFQIDDEYYNKVWPLVWNISVTGYPTCSGLGTLHEYLFGHAPYGLEWDHINRNKLDNRKENLKLVTHAENCQNSSLRKDNTTGYRGTVCCPQGFYVRIGLNSENNKCRLI